SPKVAEVPAAPMPAKPSVRREASVPKKVPSPTQAEEPTARNGQGGKASEPAAPVLPKKEPVQVAKEEPVQIAMNRPDPTPETPKTAPKATTPVVPASTKAYPPEDLPLPSKAVPTEETRQAVAALTPEPHEPAVQPADAAPAGSNNFRLGMAAYRQQDFVNAIRSFSSVPKPITRKRGTVDRDEYVQANFLKGMALLKVGHMSEAVTAFSNVLEFEKYYPMANMNLGICYVELKQYAKAHQAFEAVIRDQNRLEPANYDDVMQRTKYFWAVAWTRLFKNSTNPDKQNYYRAQAIQKWKDYQVWFSKNDKYKEENIKAENYLKSLSSL
ncbi:MAG TPA: tetratricopeptide repeat protein, partial [Fibrobacteria bacterium]|nr:tetratricopeptide repeat protein [Fibrobacteria bacterium]